MRRLVVPLLGLTLLLAACTDDGPVDRGPGAPDASQPTLPADGGLDLDDVEVAADAPPRDAELAEVTWPEAAAWIRRETEAGRPVVVNFFASWCEPCKSELPLLTETAAREDEISFLGVHTNDQLALGRDMVAEYGIEFPTFHDTEGDEIVYQVGGRGLPHTVAFDTEGRLVSRVFGELTATTLDDLLDDVR